MCHCVIVHALYNCVCAFVCACACACNKCKEDQFYVTLHIAACMYLYSGVMFQGRTRSVCAENENQSDENGNGFRVLAEHMH